MTPAVRPAALYAIIPSFSPKFDALVNSIPTAIVGGAASSCTV